MQQVQTLQTASDKHVSAFLKHEREGKHDCLHYRNTLDP